MSELTSKEMTQADLARATQLTPEEEADIAFKLSIAHRCAQAGKKEHSTLFGDALGHIQRLNRRLDELRAAHEPPVEQSADRGQIISKLMDLHHELEGIGYFQSASVVSAAIDELRLAGPSLTKRNAP
jgi:hypothetical protein